MSNPATQEDADEASSTASVLLVDDEPNVLKSLNRLLRRRGYVVHMCTCPEQALKLLEQLDPKVIVSDYRMPQMNGVEFLHRARQLRPRAMRILLSGQADREVIIEA
ncbi:MAG: response regulator, partial [Myxococcales bacterium]|nr:response regulator [Myxococcales bacterium]